MQKRISFVQILQEVNAIYAPSWTNLLLQIKQSSPILCLQPFGSIVLIENALYLIIGEDLLGGMTPIKPMISLQQYFIKPYNSRLNIRDLTKLQSYVVKFFIDYVQRMVPLHGRSIYRHVIDFSLLGQLTISKSAVSFQNGGNRWKYERKVQRIELPRLMALQDNENQSSIQKMAKSLSLQMKRQLKSESKQNKVNLKRSVSMSRIKASIQTLQPTVPHESKPSLKQMLANNKKTKFKLTLDKAVTQPQQQPPTKKLSTEPSQTIAATPFKLKTEQTFSRSSFARSRSKSKLPSRQKSKNKYEESSFKSKNNKIKLPAQKNRLTLSRQSKQTLLPRQREKMLKIEDVYQKQRQKDTYEFVERSTARCLYNQGFNKVQPHKIKEYLTQICKIYLAKQQEGRRLRLNNEMRIKKQDGKYKKMTKVQLGKSCNLIKCVTATEQLIFNEYFKLVQTYKLAFKKLTIEYYILYAQHYQLMEQCVSSLRGLNSRTGENQKLKIRIALLLNNLYQYVDTIQGELLNAIIIRREKFISVSVSSESSFPDDIQQTVATFESIFEPLISFIKISYPRILHLQHHQTSNIQLCKQRMLELMSNCEPIFQQNLSKFKTTTNKTIISTAYSTEKQSIALIGKIYVLRQRLDSELDFKGHIATDGVSINMLKVKQYYLSQLDSKLLDLYQFLKKIYEKSESQLNMRLKAIVSINVDYLNDYKCKEYKQVIEQNYKNVVQCIMMIINEIRPQSKGLQMEHYLEIALSFKQKIRQNFYNFDAKVREYRNFSIKNIRLLQSKNKENKQILRELTKRLKHLLQSLINERSILQSKIDIMALEEEYNCYCIESKNMMVLMKENDIVYWEDDSFFPTHMQLLKASLQFLESKNYKTLFNISLYELTFEQFLSAYQQFDQFMSNFNENRMQRLFKPVHTLLQEKLSLIETALYNGYNSVDLQKARQIGFDLEAEKASKILAMVKRYQSLQRKKQDKLLELYQQARLREFQLGQSRTCKHIQVVKVDGQFGTSCIGNLQELKNELQTQGNMQAHGRLRNLQQTASLYDQVLLFHNITNLITNCNLKHENKVAMQQEINTDYSQLLNLHVQAIAISRLKHKIETYKFKYMEILYLEKIKVFPQYCLVNIHKLIQLSNWQTAYRIRRNVRHLFEDIDEVQIVNQGSISCLVLGRDKIHIEKTIKVWQKQGDKSKQVHMHITNLMREGIDHSEFTSTSIKILIWSIYYTQQVELNLMTDVPLSQLKARLLQIISEIASQIRYDINKQHISFQITQLQAFLNHLQKIINLQAVTDYEWVSTLRFYEKLKVIRVEQNGRAYQYGFQPKKPMNFDPTFQLQTNISYGLPDCSTYYQVSSFILGQPYRTFNRLSDFGFQKDYTTLIGVLKKYKFYIRIIVDAVNCKTINYLHKNILQFSFKKMKEKDEETLRLPIFLQYKSEQDISACFPQKMRKFSAPEFSYSINIVVRLRLNRWQQKLDSFNINMEVICKALAYISSNKKLSLKKAVQFMDCLQRFLEERQNTQDIYKFCFKYFLVNFQVQDSQLSIILQNLIIKKGQVTLKSQSQRLIQLLTVFKDSKQSLKHHLIVYGDTSTKTYSIQQAGIPYYKLEQTPQSLTHIEGISSFLAIRSSDSTLTGRFAIEDRYIWDIDPVDIADNALHYVNQFDGDIVEAIFKQKISGMQIEGDYNKLWIILSSLHQIYCSLSTDPSFLGMVSLIVRVFSKDIAEFISQLQPQIQKGYRVGINKDIITAFLVIAHQMYFYVLETKLRKQFSERVKELPCLLDYQSDDLPSLTCNGTNCEKIVSLIKKQRNIHSNIGNYMKQLILIKKYLRYNQTVVVQYSNSVMLNLIKDSFNDLEDDRMSLTTEAKHLNLIKRMRYKKMLYVVDELHLAAKKQITFLKTHQEHHHNPNYKYVLMSRDRNYVKAMSNHITFRYQELELDQIFKYQTRSGINEVILQRSKLLKANGFFINQAEFLFFLIRATIKLPSQYYNKYYARLLIFNKLSLQKRATASILQTEKYLKETISITSQNAYLSNSKGTHQQINELQISSRIEKSLQKFSFLEQTIIKDHYKVILPYMLADRIYVIREDVDVLPILISAMHDRKHYELCDRQTFARQLISIVEDNYKEDGEFTVVLKQPLSTSAQCYYFLLHYLKGVDLISLYGQFQQFSEMLTKKLEFVYRLSNQQIVVMEKIKNILYRKMKLVICLTRISQFDAQICLDYAHKIVCINSQLDEQSRGRVASALYSKISTQQTQLCQKVLKKQQVMILGLVKANLIDLGRLQTFLMALIANIGEEALQIDKKQQSRSQKRILLDQLMKIKRGVEESLNLQKTKLQKSNQLLSDVMKKIDLHKKQEETSILSTHNQNLTKLKNAFTGSEIEASVQLDSHPQYQSFYHLLRQSYFQDQLTQIEQYPFLNINAARFLQLQLKVEVRAALAEACEGGGEQLNSFILHRYLKYMLKIIEEYDSIKPTVQMVNQEVRQINYFYLIDVAIHLKKKCRIIQEQYVMKQNQNRIFDSIISALVQLEHLSVDQKFILNDSLSVRVERVVKNYSIDFDQLHTNSMLETQTQQSSKIMGEFDEYLLKQREAGFQQFCTDLIKRGSNLTIYDPYWRIESFCASMEMDVVYVSSESDLAQVHEYRFVPTIFCILLPTIDSYYEDRQLIDACQSILLKKHNDLSKNTLQKLALWITDKRLLTEMEYSYPIINLDYTLVKFIHFVQESILDVQFEWKALKEQYCLVKRQLVAEIELVKTLSSQEILIYCIKLEELVGTYEKLREQIRSASQTQIIQPEWHTYLEQIYSTITKLNHKFSLHFNLSMRLLKKVNFIDLLTKWGSLVSSSPQQRSQFLKDYLLSINSDKIMQELQQCISESRYIVVVYTNFNHKIIKEILELEESGRYQLRLVLQINPIQIRQFMQRSAFGSIANAADAKQIVLFFVKQAELIKLEQILPKCSVLRI